MRNVCFSRVPHFFWLFLFTIVLLKLLDGTSRLSLIDSHDVVDDCLAISTGLLIGLRKLPFIIVLIGMIALRDIIEFDR